MHVIITVMMVYACVCLPLRTYGSQRTSYHFSMGSKDWYQLIRVSKQTLLLASHLWSPEIILNFKGCTKDIWRKDVLGCFLNYVKVHPIDRRWRKGCSPCLTFPFQCFCSFLFFSIFSIMSLFIFQFIGYSCILSKQNRLYNMIKLTFDI